MKIAYITAGAANMFCGSCLHDNALAAALQRQGHDAVLVPTYTPIRTDEPDVSLRRVFFGGLNVYLQQRSGLFRHTPWFLDRLLDARGLLRLISRFAVKTEAAELGALTLSMLRGEHGHQRKEIDKLATWLAEFQPEVINLTNVLLSGMVPALKRRLGVPILATLQGDDIYLESLPAADRAAAMALIREHCRQIDGFMSTSAFYADFMAGYLDVPRERIHVVYPGLNLGRHGGPRPAVAGEPPVIGYLARICPEKGLHMLVEAFGILRRQPGAPPARLRVAGWLGANQQPYLEELRRRLDRWGLADAFEHVECSDHASKVRFLRSLDLFSVPTTYREPKGLFVLEAWANGLPVVQPRHGSFPELIERTGGGLLVQPDDPADLAQGLAQLLQDPARRQELGRRGYEGLAPEFTDDHMARRTAEVYRTYFHSPAARPSSLSSTAR